MEPLSSRVIRATVMMERLGTSCLRQYDTSCVWLINTEEHQATTTTSRHLNNDKLIWYWYWYLEPQNIWGMIQRITDKLGNSGALIKNLLLWADSVASQTNKQKWLPRLALERHRHCCRDYNITERLSSTYIGMIVKPRTCSWPCSVPARLLCYLTRHTQNTTLNIHLTRVTFTLSHLTQSNCTFCSIFYSACKVNVSLLRSLEMMPRCEGQKIKVSGNSWCQMRERKWWFIHWCL